MTCCAIDDEYVEDNVVGVHGDDGFAIQRIAKGSERHNFVEPLAKLLMRRALQVQAHGSTQITHICILAVQEVHIVVIGQVFRAGATAERVTSIASTQYRGALSPLQQAEGDGVVHARQHAVVLHSQFSALAHLHLEDRVMRRLRAHRPT